MFRASYCIKAYWAFLFLFFFFFFEELVCSFEVDLSENDISQVIELGK